MDGIGGCDYDGNCQGILRKKNCTYIYPFVVIIDGTNVHKTLQ